MALYHSLGTQTDLVNSWDVGVQCNIEHRSSTPDIQPVVSEVDPIHALNITGENESDQEDSLYEVPQHEPICTR